jgi:alkyldihydroxyacetonephosphate synthase
MTMVNRKPRRSIWMNGLQADEPTEAQRREQARALSRRLGIEVELPPIPRVEDLQLRPPRIRPPAAIEEFCFSDNYERALHTKGDRLEEIRGIFANPRTSSPTRARRPNSKPSWTGAAARATPASLTAAALPSSMA